MGWKEVLLSSLYLATLVESTSRSGRFWSINVGVETSALYSWAVSSAAVFVVVALVLSMYLIFEHLAAYKQPEEQKFLIGLILMVPVYAVESFLSLLDSDAAFKCEIIRDCYEAFAMYCFERYLIACLGGEVSTIEFMECQSWVASSIPLLDQAYSYGVVEHPFPLNCFLRDWELGPDFYQAVKNWDCSIRSLARVLKTRIQDYIICIEIQPFDFTLLKATKLIATIVNSTISDSKYVFYLVELYGIDGCGCLIHLYVFPSAPQERCVRNVSVMADYASLGSPPDPEEVQESEKYSRLCISQRGETETGPKLHQNVCDVVFGSGEIIVDDMMFTVSHVVEPVERGLAKVNRTFHQISEK
ncbi:UNVERIFIED_CONTAM: protein LAZ11 [Sesamum calycinum]|uniref:Protein LAZ11 n=1 Tax=Sesamum calycinum TaxID=2727403 RepID=A0AAW2P5N5_9LAMI